MEHSAKLIRLAWLDRCNITLLADINIQIESLDRVVLKILNQLIISSTNRGAWTLHL
jgi:hypothetical protein